jgi:hypothetical protein
MRGRGRGRGRDRRVPSRSNIWKATLRCSSGRLSRVVKKLYSPNEISSSPSRSEPCAVVRVRVRSGKERKKKLESAQRHRWWWCIPAKRMKSGILLILPFSLGGRWSAGRMASQKSSTVMKDSPF